MPHFNPSESVARAILAATYLQLEEIAAGIYGLSQEYLTHNYPHNEMRGLVEWASKVVADMESKK